MISLFIAQFMSILSIMIFCLLSEYNREPKETFEYNKTSPLPTIAEQVAKFIVLDVICDQESKT
jgi:hypothetical protein